MTLGQALQRGQSLLDEVKASPKADGNIGKLFAAQFLADYAAGESCPIKEVQDLITEESQWRLSAFLATKEGE